MMRVSSAASEGHRTVIKRGGMIANVVLAGALLVGCLNYIEAIYDRAPKKDGFQYYCIAANIHDFWVYTPTARML